MSGEGSGDFIDQLKAFEGRQVGAPTPAPDPVNQAMIRHWVEAVGDELAIYTDAEAGAASVHGGIVAPPVMLQAWIMRGFAPRPTEGGSAQDELMSLLDSQGYTSVVATNCDQEYHRYLKPGDDLNVTAFIEAVSDEKTTGLGVGHFVTSRQEYRDQDGELVGTMTFRILKFRPADRAEAPPERPKRPRPVITHDSLFWFEGAKEHKLLIQKCSDCGALRHPPGPMCHECQSLNWAPLEASGKGIVYSYAVNHHPKLPAFDYPLPVGLIELEEGTRLVADIVGIEPDDIEIGMAVMVEFADHDHDLSLPQFRPVGGQ
jgi:uncharacterized OB-fold protein/acyl dehydratase